MHHVEVSSYLICNSIFAANLPLNIWIGAIQSNACVYRFKWCESGEVLLRNDSKWFGQKYYPLDNWKRIFELGYLVNLIM